MQYTDVRQTTKIPITPNQLYDKPDQAKAYSRCRPEPPQELVDNIISYLNVKFSSPFGKAVDVGCGAGQSTVVLAPYFNSVLGCDISKSQIQEAIYFRKAKSIQYSLAPAECLPVDDQSVQLLTAATCFHWFDFDAFFREAERVLVPEGVLAVYSSPIIRPITEDKDKDAQLKWVTDKLFYEDLAPYRSPRIQFLYEQYRNIHFPFEDILRIKEIPQTYLGSAADATGHFQSMSTFQMFREVNPRLADKLLLDYQSSIMNILDSNLSPEHTPLAFRKEYFLILCRKRSEKKSWM